MHPQSMSTPHQASATDDPLAPFEPAVQAYFRSNYTAPTEVQKQSWPVIAAGEHALITAPTGSGKTLTAFLWALNRFAAGSLKPGHTSVLYLSPLKALNNDIRANLLEPLHALAATPGYPAIRALTRSGDTSSSERQKLLRRPPKF